MEVGQLQGPDAKGNLVEWHADDDEEFGVADLPGVVDEPCPALVVGEGPGELGVAEA